MEKAPHVGTFYKCAFCDTTFPTLEGLKTHHGMKHWNACRTPKYTIQKELPPLTCPKCLKRLKSVRGLRTHFNRCKQKGRLYDADKFVQESLHKENQRKNANPESLW